MTVSDSGGNRPLRVVVGGGISGLAAAYFLADDPTHDVLLLEGEARLGGKLRTEPVAGVPLDVGAEAMLNRRPEGVDLCRAVGLEIIHPTEAESQIWVRGALRPLPRTLFGIPLDLESLEASGIMSPAGLARAREEATIPPTPVEEDVSVGDLVAGRCGDEVVNLLVEPLLGGVYSGLARELSVLAAAPMVAAFAAKGSFLELGSHIPTTYDAPMFACVPHGMGSLPDAMAASGRFAIRTGAPVRALRRLSDRGVARFAVVIDSPRGTEVIEAADVVLATPTAAAAQLLTGLADKAAAELGAIENASVAVVTFGFRARDLEAARLPGSGFLVPPTEGRAVKASTFSYAKWDWVREAGRGAADGEDVLFLRTSLGRHRDDAIVAADDAELVEVSLRDLGDAVGVRARPLDSHVQRWTAGLPQYAVGHVDRVARIRADLAGIPGLAVCGAAYDGVGIPAVIDSARRAVTSLTGVVSDVQAE